MPQRNATPGATMFAPTGEVSASDYGFQANGQDDNGPVLLNFIQNVGAASVRLVFTPGAYVFGPATEVYVPANIELEMRPGAVLCFGETGAVYLAGPLVAGRYPVIERDPAGTGGLFPWGNETVRPEWWGAVYDGQVDSTDAFQSMLDALKPRHASWSDMLRGSHATTVLLASAVHDATAGADTDPGHSYVVHRSIQLPNYRSITLRGEGPSGARIRNADPLNNPWIFTLDDEYGSFQWRSLKFERMVFHDGGVQLDQGGGNASTQGGVFFEHCLFFGGTSYAIEIGLRIVYGAIRHCNFDTSGGVGFTARDSDLWVVEHCTFNRGGLNGTYPDLTIRSSGVTVRDCDFETRKAGTPDHRIPPHILIDGMGIGVKILDNRFGNEPHPARYSIACGPEGTNAPSAALNNVHIRGNLFRGVGSQSSREHSGRAAVRLNLALQHSLIEGNFFWNYHTFVEEAFVSVPAGYARNTRTNLWRNNQFAAGSARLMTRTMVFDRGGVGWDVDLDAALPARRVGAQKHVNHLTRPERLDTWQTVRSKVIRDVESPAGEPAGAWRLIRGGGSSSYIRSPLQQVPGGVPLILSVWARAGTNRVMRIGALDDKNSFVSPFNEGIVLTEAWRRYAVTLATIEAGDTLSVLIYNGADGSTETDGDICVYAPRLDLGDVPPETSRVQGTEVHLQDFVTAVMGDADHSEALAQALEVARHTGRAVRIPHGTWRFQHVEPLSGMRLRCDPGAEIQGVGAQGAIFLDTEQGTLKELQIYGGRWTQCDYVLQRINRSSLLHSRFENMKCRINAGGAAFALQSSIQNVWQGCDFAGAGKGVVFLSHSQSNINTFRDCKFQNMQALGVESIAVLDHPEEHVLPKDEAYRFVPPPPEAAPQPTLTISTPLQQVPRTGRATLYFRFSEPISQFTINDIEVSNGAVEALRQDPADPTIWQATYIAPDPPESQFPLTEMVEVAPRSYANRQGNLGLGDTLRLSIVKGSVAPNYHLHFQDCWFEQMAVGAIYARGAVYGLHLDTCYFEGNGAANAPDVLLSTPLRYVQGRKAKIDNCVFANPHPSQSVARIALRGATHARIDDNMIHLNTGQVAIEYAVANVWRSEFHRNYLSARGGGPYRNRLFNDASTNDPHWSAAHSGEATHDAPQTFFRGLYQADRLLPVGPMLAPFESDGTALVGRVTRCDPSQAGFTILLHGDAVEGDRVIIKNVSSSSNPVTLTAPAQHTIDGASGYVLDTPRGFVELIYDGAGDWMIVSAR